jgi:hypothetical protein
MTEDLAARTQPEPWTGSDLTPAHDERQASLATRPPGQRVASWIAWHLPELACSSGSLALATWVDVWFLTASAAIGGGWAVHEWRTARRARLLQGQLQLTSPDRSSHNTAHASVTSKNETQGGGGT